MKKEKLTAANRPDGVYWVKDRREGWRLAKWNSVQEWWVLAWVDMSDGAYPSGCVSDSRFLEIGPMIEPPG